MGKRSLIAAKYGETYKVIYCHFDGYLSGVGTELNKDYQDQQKIDDLLDLGNILYLEKECTCPKGHSYMTPVRGYTVAYHRDRDEDWEEARPQEVNSLQDILIIAMEQKYAYAWDGYIYIWDGGRWNVLDHDAVLTPLEEVIKRELKGRK